MKKCFVAFLVCLALALVFTSSVSAAEFYTTERNNGVTLVYDKSGTLLGRYVEGALYPRSASDNNADGRIDAGDVIRIVKHLSEEEVFPLKEIGDANFDGKIDVLDAITAVKNIGKMPELNMKNQRQNLFGFYGASITRSDTVRDIDQDPNVTCAILGGRDTNAIKQQVQKQKEAGNFFWINTQYLEHSYVDGKMNIQSDWQNRLKTLAGIAKDAGADDLFLGFYMDEPLHWGFSNDDILMLSKYVHDIFSKRFFVCFAVHGIAPEIWGAGRVPTPIDREHSLYITDAAFDTYVYHSENVAAYQATVAYLHDRMPLDCNFWYVPRAFFPLGSMEGVNEADHKWWEDEMLDHINAMYGYYKQETNRGGFLPFSWNCEWLEPGEHLYGIGEAERDGYFPRVLARLDEIAKEMAD